MATYQEIFDLKSNNSLRNKIAVAVVIKAGVLIDKTPPSANDIAWANNAIHDPLAMAEKIMNYVLAANKSATVAQINAATDSAIQTNVDAAVDKLVAGGIVS